MGWWNSSVGRELWDSGIAQWVENYGIVVEHWTGHCMRILVRILVMAL